MPSAPRSISTTSRTAGEEDYIPNPATWLNQGRWEDEIAPPPETPEQRKERELDEHQAKRRERWAAEAKGAST